MYKMYKMYKIGQKPKLRMLWLVKLKASFPHVLNQRALIIATIRIFKRLREKENLCIRVMIAIYTIFKFDDETKTVIAKAIYDGSEGSNSFLFFGLNFLFLEQ